MRDDGAASPPRWELLFDELADLDPGEQRARLEAIARQDPRLARLLGTLLAADREVGATEAPLPALPSRLVAAALLDPPPAADGGVIGSYRLVRPLGVGGMGEVFLGERSDGEFERRVAIKRIRAGRVTAGFLERFRRERQILAGLDHPGIARLLDGGRTADGDPYIVLELVEGERITDWCRRTAADLPTRIRLVREVAAAVEAAHRRLVVHRDLKPSNILVTADGRPKLLDFGIAKILADAEDEAAGGETALHGGPLTPAYAAPEQILGGPVTTATDVFALGVVLYELLAGRSPFTRRGASLAELVRSVDEETVTGPSLAARGEGSLDPATRSFAAQLAGDLDTIVIKALHRDPARRYPSAAAFADDLGRYLEGRPVKARPDRLGYRLGKLIRRHRLAFVVAAVALVLLVATLVDSGLRLAAERDVARREAARAVAERAAAEAARREAQRVSDFLVGLFVEAGPRRAGSHEVTAREILDRGGQRLAHDLAAEPVARARIEEVIARAYLGLRRIDEGFAHLAAARQARSEAGLDDEAGRARLLLLEALGHLLADEHVLAEGAATEAMRILERTPGVEPRALARAWRRGVATRHGGSSKRCSPWWSAPGARCPCGSRPSTCSACWRGQREISTRRRRGFASRWRLASSWTARARRSSPAASSPSASWPASGAISPAPSPPIAAPWRSRKRPARGTSDLARASPPCCGRADASTRPRPSSRRSSPGGRRSRATAPATSAGPATSSAPWSGRGGGTRWRGAISTPPSPPSRPPWGRPITGPRGRSTSSG